MQIQDHHHPLQPYHRPAPPADRESIRSSRPPGFRSSLRKPGKQGHLGRIQTALLGSITPVSTDIGVLVLQLGDELIINDGQHRAAGIVQALTDGVPIGREAISVLLFPWESTERVQQMFSDLNRFVQKTSKSLDILYDKRDELAACTLDMMEQVPVFKELTDKENISLSVKSTKLFTLAALYDANAELLKGREKEAVLDRVDLLVAYWTAVAEHMPDWSKVLQGRKLALELRQENISSHSTVLRALGGLGIDIIDREDWQAQLRALEAIDWSKNNKEWENICVAGNSVLSNRQARAATKAFIKHKLHLTLTDAERRILATGMLEGGIDRREAIVESTPSEEYLPRIVRVRG